MLGLPEVGLGITPGTRQQRLPRLIGRGRAIERITTGAARRKRRSRSVKVVPQAELLAEAEKLAQAVIKNGPLAVGAALEAAIHGPELGLADGLRLESSRFGNLAASEDMHEGLQAFLDKRPPRFQRR